MGEKDRHQLWHILILIDSEDAALLVFALKLLHLFHLRKFKFPLKRHHC